MTDALLRRMIESYLSVPMARYAIAFQGGEPLLMGEDFFRKAEEYGQGRIEFSVQTNATLVTPSLADFFASSGWLIGVSPHTAECEKGILLLKERGVEYNVLKLITKDDLHAPEALYHHLRDDLGAKYQQYIECSHPADYAINGADWGEFLCRLFDEWKRCGDEHTISVRNFDAIVTRLVTGREEMCQFAPYCHHYLVVDFKGDVYPCDFYVEDRWRLGNIAERSLSELYHSPKALEFAARKRNYFDCPRSRGALDAGWRRFFDYATPYLSSLLG